MIKTFLCKQKKIVKVAIIVLATFILLHFIFYFLPYPQLDNFLNQKYSTRVYDSKGTLLQITSLENGLRREFIPSEKIAWKIKSAFINAEDKRFYFHFGIDFFSMGRAIVQNKNAQKNVSGASTITMQLSKIINKNFYNRSVKLKIQEAICALKLEARFSKNQILEMYLNSLPFGNNVEGVQSASRLYFVKDVNDLSETEINLLSKIPRRPALYSPKKSFEYPFYCPHLINYLQSKNFFSKENKIEEVHLSVDLKLQNEIEKLASFALNQVKENRIKNISILAIDVQTGKVLSWVGSQNFFDQINGGQVDGVLANNQPGSAIKPFLYALALDKNIIKSNSVLPDIPLEFGQGNLYIPSNFNNRFNGPVPLRTCLASSLNIPAVYLLEKVGINNFAQKLNELKFETIFEQVDSVQSALALGGAQVSLKEIVLAFSVFARDGKYIPIQFFDDKNACLEKQEIQELQSQQVFSKDTARIIASFLSEKNARSLGFGENQSFETNYKSIFKTGTANQFQNIIALGATPRYAVGVWMGNFSGETVIGKTGSSVPARIAKEVLDYLEQNDSYESLDFLMPENYSLQKVCSLSGMKVTNNCDTSVLEFVKNDDVNKKCSWHKNQNEIYYPEIYSLYLQNFTARESSKIKIDYQKLPLEIVSPKNNSIYYLDKNMLNSKCLDLQIIGGNKSSIEIYLDEKFFAKITKPFVTKIQLEKGRHCIKVICDKQENVVFYEVR